MKNIKELVSEKNWTSLISSFSIKDICSYLSFSEAMHIVEHLFYDDFQDDEKQQYALKLAFEIKDHFHTEWENDWKNDIFLGSLCVTLWRYEDRYLCYKRVYDKLIDPPAELFYLLSCCNSAPGNPPITDEESEYFLKKAMEKKLTWESAFTMKNICRLKGNTIEEKYWDQIYKKLERENIHLDQLVPDVLR